MKISCQSCGAKYNIADDKVRGKIVKIACKKCGARIEIDGREPEARAHDQDETRVSDLASAPPGAVGAADSWTVSIDDNDQRELDTQQLMNLIRAGTVSPDTFVWRDGMADWQAVRDIAELQSAFSGAPAYPSEPPTAVHPSYDAPPAGPSFSNPGNGGGYSAPQIEASQPARLGGSRRGGAVDLFAAHPAGAEDDDVATSAPPGGALAAMAGPGAAGGKPIGARNENSVLFSLSALTASGPSTAAPVTGGGDEEKSGLIDIQKLAAAAKPNGGKDDRAKLDDIMNLGGGGAFGSALGAPILAPPPAAALEVGSYGGGEEKKSNKMLILAMGGVVALLLVVVIVLLATRKGPEEVASKDKDKGALAAPKADETKDKDKPAGGSDTTVSAPTTTAPDPGGGPIGKPGTKATAGGTGPAKPGTTSTATAAPTTTVAEKPTSTGPASKCTTLDCAMGAGAKDPPPPPKPTATAAEGGEIDKGAVKSSLGAIPYKDCGSGGPGKVQVTFGPNGNVTSAVVTSGEYDGGTKSCIQNRFKGAKVPAYGGAPKSFAWSVNL